MTDADPETPPSEGSPPLSSVAFTRIMRGLLVFGLGVGVAGLAQTCPRGRSTGEIRATGAPLGDFVVTPVTCFIGDHWDFDGVWVVTETLSEGSRTGFRGGLKIIKDERGEWSAVVESPDRCEVFTCEQTRIDPSACTRWDLVVERRHRLLRHRGHARLECSFPQGGTLSANLDFTRCGWVPSSGDDS